MDPNIQEEIKHGVPLKHAPQTHDTTHLPIDPNFHLQATTLEPLLSDIKHGVQLVHPPADAVHDRSSPVIDPNVHVEPNHHAELMEEVVHPKQPLVHHEEPPR